MLEGGNNNGKRAESLTDFGLTSQQCRLLVLLESVNSVVELATVMRRDPSVISRQLKQIASVANVIEKRGGTWQLTSLGKKVNNWTRDAILSQNQILRQGGVVRIAAAREFASLVLAPTLGDIVGTDRNIQVSILTTNSGIEQSLLTGEADLGFDYGRPTDPLVRFKAICDLPFVVVASPQFIAKHGIQSANDLHRHPHLQFSRKVNSSVMASTDANVIATFNDISVVREACKTGSGWAVLPYYAVKEELEQKTLVALPGWEIPNEKLGVWWIAGRQTIKPWVDRAIEWLKTRKLSSQD